MIYTCYISNYIIGIDSIRKNKLVLVKFLHIGSLQNYIENQCVKASVQVTKQKEITVVF